MSHFWHRTRYLGLSLLVACSLMLSQPRQVLAQSFWERLFLGGAELIQLSSLNPQEEVAMGRQINQTFMQQGLRLIDDPQVNEYVSQLGSRLVASSRRSQLPYTFHVVRDANVNAFATMGGFVYVTSGLIQAADNEAQLASVIGHEIGHIEGKHLLKQMRQTAFTRGLISAAGLDNSLAVRLGSELAFRRPRSRQDEFDADQRGLRILTSAGLAESAMPAFMRKLINRAAPPTVLSTHPAAADRATTLERSISSQPGNLCRQESSNPSCGLDPVAYRQIVRDRLAGG